MSEVINISIAGFVLRIASALVITLAAAVIIYLVRKDRLKPSFVWHYVATITAFTAIWRWVVVLLANGDLFPSTSTIMADWITPISATLYLLNGVALIAAAISCACRSNGDE